MKLAMLAAVALAGLMDEANDGTTGAAGGVAEDTVPPAEKAENVETAPNVADTSGDVDGQPAGAHLDAPSAKPVEGEAVVQAEPEKTDDEYANALAAGKPRSPWSASTPTASRCS
jgi:hypothetical protein